MKNLIVRNRYKTLDSILRIFTSSFTLHPSSFRQKSPSNITLPWSQIMQFSEIKIAYSYNYLIRFRQFIWHICAMSCLEFSSYARKITNIPISSEPEIVYPNYAFNCLRHDFRTCPEILS
jgi:hypothetical protein